VRLTPTQRTALISIVDRFDRAVRDERTRWGEESATRVAARGVETFEFDYRTLHALANRGLVRLTSAESRGEELRRGSFGRWIGGTRKSSHVILFAAPTDLGRVEAL
jgi:hypothetical protein